MAVAFCVCACTCREDILELDGIHKHLLMKLCPLDSTDYSSQFMPHQTPQPLKETTVLRTSGMLQMDAAPPLAPPTLLRSRLSNSDSFSKGMSQSVGLQSSPLKHVHHGPDKTIVTTLSSKSSSLLSADSLTQSEATSEQSLSVSPPPAPLGELSSLMHGLVEEEGERRQMASPEDTPTPLSGSRSGSLTDVSICSEDSSVVVQSRDVEMQSIPQKQMKTDLPGKLDENEQLASNSDSSSESSSICSSPQPTLEAKVADMDKRDALPSSERLPTSTTSTTSTISHPVTAVPLDTLTSMTTTVPHHTQTPHSSTSGQEKSPKTVKNNSPRATLTSEHHSMSTSDRRHEKAPPPLLAPPPPLPTFQLPNFFMTPQQLEESMRSLRAGALSRTPPRTHAHHHPPPTTTASMQAQCHHQHCVPSVASHLKTLQEVRSYLESRRTAVTDTRPKAKEISAMETQRLARIFSS